MFKTIKRSHLLLASAVVITWATQILSLAQTCTFEECGNATYRQNNTCYTLKPVKWCRPASLPYTPVNVYNHTRYPQVEASWSNWNNPRVFGNDRSANSVFLKTDGVNNSSHDIDYWEVYDPNGQWFGEFKNPGGFTGGCYKPKSGLVNLNSAKLGGPNNTPINANRALSTAEHETGHGIGLAHVCNCPHIMIPCVNCGTALSVCDSQGAHALYP